MLLRQTSRYVEVRNRRGRVLHSRLYDEGHAMRQDGF